MVMNVLFAVLVSALDHYKPFAMTFPISNAFPTWWEFTPSE